MEIAAAKGSCEVVTAAEQQRMKCIAIDPLQPTPPQSTVIGHVPIRGLDGAAATDVATQALTADAS
ncbi:hypothetical protein [Duganella sp. Root1480D1]|uniref:hypothetical protein n=1 Tax=Duganella sp. Root1480D1 TaxID=1736471 RepID=UPI000A462728|nr:hypothetical protein [Duganella sp. Root1480D1]